MFSKALSTNEAVGVYTSVIESTCCYCGEVIDEGDLATFLVSKDPKPSEDGITVGDVKLYIVEVHINCTLDLATELGQVNIQALNQGDTLTSSPSIIYGDMSSTVECVICENSPDNVGAIIFSSRDLDVDDIGKNVWCHTYCLDDISGSLKRIEEHFEDIVAEEI